MSNNISGTGRVVQLGTGTTTLSGNNAYTGGTTLSAGTLTLDNNTHNLTLKNGATVTGSASGNLRFGYFGNAALSVSGSSASKISGNLNLVKVAGTADTLTMNVADVTSSACHRSDDFRSHPRFVRLHRSRID